MTSIRVPCFPLTLLYHLLNCISKIAGCERFSLGYSQTPEKGREQPSRHSGQQLTVASLNRRDGCVSGRTTGQTEAVPVALFF